MNINDKNSFYTVIVTVAGKSSYIESVLEHVQQGLMKFQESEGFIAGATHVSEPKDEILQYFQWKNREAYESCMKDWSSEETTAQKKFVDLIQRGKLSADVQSYKVVRSVERPG